MIRFIKLFLSQVFLMVKHAAKVLIQIIATVLALFVGRFAWQAPLWLRKTGRAFNRLGLWCQKHTKAAISLLVALIIIIAAGIYGGHWYVNRPKPYMVAYKVTAPELNAPALTVRFNDSVAPLNMVNQPVATGVTLTPAMEGEWHWTNDRTLHFTPETTLPKQQWYNVWPINTNYKVTLDKKNLLKTGALLEKYQFEFTTPQFKITDFSMQLYQDPTAPEQKKIVATLAFTHPLDRARFEKLVSFELSKGLQYLDRAQTAPEFLYDNNDRKVYVHSALLATPLENSAVKLFVDKGVSAKAGGNSIAEPRSLSVNVPGLYQLTFANSQIFFVDNAQGEPEPVLAFESSHTMADDAIKNQVTAWLLPERDDKNRRKYWSVESVSEQVLAQSTKVELTHIDSDNPQNVMHAFKFKVPPERQIYVKVNANVKALGGYIARKETVFIKEMPNYPQTLTFLSDGALLNLNGSKDLGIMARGVPGARVEIARVLPRQLHLLVNQLDGNFKRPDMSEHALDQLTERFKINVPIVAGDPGKTVYTHVNLASYLDASSAPQGIFVLHLGAHDPANQRDTSVARGPDDVFFNNGDDDYYSDDLEYYDIWDTRFIVITDLGIIAKTTANNTHEVFVQSISTGLPVDGVVVDVYGVNGLPVVSALTNAEGRVSFENLDALNREKKPLMYVVTKNADMSFLPIASSSRHLNFSRFNIGGVTEQNQAGQLNAYLFTDRGLYRPGETAHIASIVRTFDWGRSLEGLPVQMYIIDPRGKVVQNNNFKLSHAAFDSVEFTSSVNAPAGTYSAELYLIGPNNQSRYLNSVTFSVRDFEPDRMKVTVKLSNEPVLGWLKPSEVKAQVTAMQLFGAPASDRRAVAEIDVRPAFIAFSGYGDYRFFLEKDFQDSSYSFFEKLPETVTDANGEATFPINLNQFEASAYRLDILATVFEAQGGRNVKDEARVMVSTADYLVGVKTPDPLDYINKGAQRKIHWIAVDQNLETIAVSGLTYELIEVRYVSVLVKQNNGTYGYESRRKDLLVEKGPFELGATGFEQTLKTSEPGTFIVKIKRGETLLNQISYMVAGSGNASRALDRNAELQLNLNKTTYAPGEEIEISIRAPYTGAGLITIERDKVYNHVWFTTNTTSSVQKITVPNDLEGNAYVNVQFVRGINSEEIYMSPLSYGVAPFNISLDNRRINVSLNTPALIEPGETIPITVNLNQAGRVVVYGVDEGILQVARYKKPAPLEYFFRKRALGVRTAQILDLILPEFNLLMRAAAAGGDDEGALAANLNPFKRKNKPPVVWWSGITALPAGETKFEWQVPDYFNGKLHFFAVAVSERHIGATQAYADVRGPVVLTPNVPAFITPGDVVKVSTGVFNNLPETVTVKMLLETGPGLKPLNDEPLALTIDSIREGVAVFDLTALDTLGSADLVFVAELPDGKQIRLAETTSVRPAAQYRVQLNTGMFTGKEFKLPLNRTLYTQLRNVQTGVDSSPLVWGQGLKVYLDNYPHACTEQLLSKAMPALAWGTPVTEESVTRLNAATSVLRQRQNSAGGFGMWTATATEGSAFVSLYAADFLLEAKERGFYISGDLLDYANRYVSKVANDASTQGLGELRNRAYAIYLLTRQGVVANNQLSDVRERLETYFEKTQWQNDIIAVYMAAAYKLMKLNKEAGDLIEKQPWMLMDKNWRTYDMYFDSLTHDAEYLNLLVKHFPERFKTIPNELLVNMGARLSEERYSSLSAGLLVRALDNYGKMAQERIDVTALARFNDEKTAVLEMLGRPVRAEVPLGVSGLVFNKTDSRTPAFYLLSEAGYDLEAPEKAISDGLEVIHDYLDLNGKPVEQVNVGDEFLVRIRLRGTESGTHYNVAVVDLLPGGVEPVYNQPESTLGDSNEYDDDEYDDNEYANAAWQPPVGEMALSDWSPDFIDLRDDRVVFYGTVTPNVQTYVYKIRATNAGTFVTPPAFAQSMYKPTVIAQGLAGKLEIMAVDNPQPAVTEPLVPANGGAEPLP